MSITNELFKSNEALPGTLVTGQGADITVNIPTRQESEIRRPDEVEESSSHDDFDPWEESLRHYGIALRSY